MATNQALNRTVLGDGAYRPYPAPFIMASTSDLIAKNEYLGKRIIRKQEVFRIVIFN